MRKRRFSMLSYTRQPSVSSNRLYRGVYHDNGHKVATDGYILVVVKENYDEKLEGLVVGRKGVIIDKKYKYDDGEVVVQSYPNWRLVIPRTESCEPIPFDMEKLFKIYDEYRIRFRETSAPEFVQFGGALFSIHLFYKAMVFAQHFKIETACYIKHRKTLIIKNEVATCVLMAYNPDFATGFTIHELN